MKSQFRLIFGVFIALCAAPGFAQSPPAATGGGYAAVFAEFSASRPGQGSGFIYGPTLGGYYQSGLFGLTARGQAYRWGGGADIHVYTGLLGPRLAMHVPFFTTYVEALGGYGHAGYRLTRPDGTRGSGSSYGFAWQLDGGLEHGILPRIKWRVAELAYGKVYAGPTVTSTTISTGLVFTLF